MPTTITTRACCRVDLGGGTLDIWPLGLLHPGARTVNLAIGLEARVTLEERAGGYRAEVDGERFDFDSTDAMCAEERTALVGEVARHFDLPPCVIRTSTDSPRGAGLGGSSALAIALIAAIERHQGRSTPPAERATVACDLEARLMNLPTGRQDQYPALLGGALEIVYRPGGERVRRLDADLEALGRSLVVAYSGQSHFSAGNNWQVVRRRLDGDADSRRLFDGIAEAAAAMPAAVESADWAEVGALMAREWSFRRRLAEGISTPLLEDLLAAATEAGAWGGKACGAGGGGCIAVLCPEDRRAAVCDALTATGGEVLTAPPEHRGVSVTGPDN